MAARSPCPGCGQTAPIVIRGVEAFCTVCGTRRTPFATTMLNLSGKPAQFGGIAARLFGWGSMVIGLFVALFLGLVSQAVFTALFGVSWVGLAVGGPIALFALLLGLVGIFGGRKLGKMGAASLKRTQLETIRGVAAHRDGIVRARDVAASLGIREAQADAMLTELAKQPDENVGVDVDDEGDVLYLFGSSAAKRWRIKAEAAGISEADRVALEAELDAAAAEEAAAEEAAAEGRAGGP